MKPLTELKFRRKAPAPRTHNSTLNANANRKTNAERRPREHLLEAEVDALVKSAGTFGRYAERDRLLLLMMFRHALRVSEAAKLHEDQLQLGRNPAIAIKRSKNGAPSTQPMLPDEIRLLGRVLAARPANHGGYIFTSERGGRIAAGNARRIVKRAGSLAGLQKLKVHPHMFRHATGYKFVNAGVPIRIIQDYLGHKNIRHTVRYTALSPEAFKHLWEK